MGKICNKLNPLESKGNYSVTLNNMKLVHWSLMGGLLHLVQRGGDWAGLQLYNGPLLCSFNVPLKGSTEELNQAIKKLLLKLNILTPLLTSYAT